MNAPAKDQPSLNNFIKSAVSLDGSFVPNYETNQSILSKAIFSLLTPKWLRFSSIDPEVSQGMQDQINTQLKAGLPIKIINACGGFKNARLDSAPHVDYAEAFHLAFFINSVILKIAAIYEPGATLEYSGDAQMASYVDNLPVSSVETYLKEFNSLIDDFSSKLPRNAKITHKHLLDFYDYGQITNEIEQRFASEDLSSAKNQELIAKYFIRAKSNFVVKGVKDYSSLSDSELEGTIKQSIIKAYIWYDLDFEHRENYLTSSLCICNVPNFPGTYCVRSVRHQPAPPFWQGKGIILDHNGQLSPIILHTTKYLELKDQLTTFAIDSPITNSPSFNQIQVLAQS